MLSRRFQCLDSACGDLYARRQARSGARIRQCQCRGCL